MSNNKFKILVVEDESNISSFIETLLETSGYHALVAHTCAMGLTLFASHTPDLVDPGPGTAGSDGQEMIRQVRKKTLTPIIVLSARTTEQDKIQAPGSGSQRLHYQTLWHRGADGPGPGGAAQRPQRLGNGAGGRVPRPRTGDQPRAAQGICGRAGIIKLTQTEYNIVSFLSEHAGRVMTYAAIVRAIWGDMDCGSTKKLQVNMANIRKKLGSRPGSNTYILNELGVGYRMVDEDPGTEEQETT